MDTANPFDLAVNRVGGRRALAAAMGVSVQALVRWRRRIPVERVIALEGLSGIPRAVLRPDIYGSGSPANGCASPLEDSGSTPGTSPDQAAV